MADVPTVLNSIPHSSKYFAVVVLCAAFFSIPIHADAQPLFAFILHSLLFEYRFNDRDVEMHHHCLWEVELGWTTMDLSAKTVLHCHVKIKASLNKRSNLSNNTKLPVANEILGWHPAN